MKELVIAGISITGLIAFLVDIWLNLMGVSGPEDILGMVLNVLKESPLYVTSGPFAQSQHMAFAIGAIAIALISAAGIIAGIRAIFA
jgi:hypothetical protein